MFSLQKFLVTACAAALLWFAFTSVSQADECPANPKTARQKCLKKTYNECNHGNGKWINPGEFTVPKGPKDTCPK